LARQIDLHTKKKSHPWPEKAPNGSDAEAISMVTSSYVARRTPDVRHPDAIGCVTTHSQCTYLRTRR
jgi:hypothetical protein